MSFIVKSVAYVWLGLMLCLPLSPKAGADEKDALGDPLPPGAVARLGTLRMRHSGPVTGVTISPDDKRIASFSPSPDRSIRLWAADSGKEIHRLEVPLCPQYWHGKDIKFAPDGTLLVGCVSLPSGSVAIRLWDVKTGKVVADMDDAAGSFAFSADGKTVVSARGITVRIFGFAERKKLREFKVPDWKFSAIALSADGRLMASVGIPLSEKKEQQDYRISLFDTSNGQEIWRAVGPREVGTHPPSDEVVFSPDGKTLAVCSLAEPVSLYDVKTGRKRGAIGTAAVSLAYSPNGSLLALASNTGKIGAITLWNVEKSQEIRRLVGHGSSLSQVTFSGDGKTLVSGSHDGTVRAWEINMGKERLSFPGHQHQISALTFLPCGTRLVSQSNDHTVRLWDFLKGDEVRRLTLTPVSDYTPSLNFTSGAPFDYPSRALSVARDGKTVAVCDPGRALVLWDTDSGERRRLSQDPKIHWASFTPDGERLAWVDQKKQTVTVGDVDGKSAVSFHTPDLFSLAFFPNGKNLLTGHRVRGTPFSYPLRLWNSLEGKEVGKWQGPVSPPHFKALVLSPDGRTVAFGQTDDRNDGKQILLVWDGPAGMARHRLKGHKSNLHGVVFSPDGKVLASAGEDRSVRIWEAATGQELLHLEGHVAGVISVAFSVDGRWLASGGVDTTILIWDLLESGGLPPSPRDSVRLWDDLASGEAEIGWRGARSLWRMKDKGVEFLNARLRPAPMGGTYKYAQQLIRELDHDKFTVRESADSSLRERGWEVAAELCQALERAPSDEVRRRLTDMIYALGSWKPSPEKLREQRAILVLERIGTEKAKNLLQTLSEGSPLSELTRDAKAALIRLRRR